MNKNLAYCPICNTKLNIKNDLYIYNCNCYNSKKFKYISAWCNKCNKFTARRGLCYPATACCRCAVKLQHKTMRETDFEGYSKRQAAAAVKANEIMKKKGKGVWDPQHHVIAEKTKLKNGTSLANQEFRKKIGCNGNPIEVINRLKREKKGIFSKTCKEINSKRFKSYWKDENWRLKDIERKRQIVKNQWSFKYDINCNSLCDKINNCGNISKELKNKYGWCKKQQIKLSGMNPPNFIIENNIKLYFDKSLKDYIPWEDFKQKFVKKRLTKDINTFIEKLKGIKDFKYSDIQIFPTFRTQDSQDWSGSRCAFEEYLVEQNIKWFTYIKFYIDQQKHIRPLVVGKTGSLLVNKAGTDVSFQKILMMVLLDNS